MWLESLPATEDRLLTLEGQRLKLETRGWIYWVDIDPVAIPTEHQMLTDDNTTALPLMVTYTIKPQDRPGQYRTVLVMREMGSEGLIKERSLPIRLQINPWVKIETVSGDVPVGSWGEEPGILINRIPGEVRVGSNSNWQLFLECFPIEELKSGDLELVLMTGEDSGFEGLTQLSVRLKEEQILLGGGRADICYDWNVNEKNELVEYEMGTLKETLDGLIRFNPRRSSLEPWESQIVRITINFPEGEGEPFERRGIIFFEHEEEAEMEEWLGAVIKTMIGAIIYARPSEFSFNFLLIEGLVLSGPSGQQVAALLLGNPSFVHARFTIDYRVVTAEGEIFEEGEVTEKVFLPETARTIYIPFQKPYPPGEYRLILELKFTDIDFRLNEVVSFRVED